MPMFEMKTLQTFPVGQLQAPYMCAKSVTNVLLYLRQGPYTYWVQGGYK